MAVAAIIIGAVLFSYLVSNIYYRLWSKNLEIVIQFKEEAVTEGMDSELTETIYNRKWIFLPMLQVRFQAHKNLKFVEGENVSVSDQCYKRDIFSVGSYQKITRTIPFHCSKRGYYEINETELETGNPLLTARYYETVRQNTCLYVYPKLIDEALFDTSFQKIMGEMQTKKTIYEDPFEFCGIREYQPTDPLTRMNWKASAKSGQWMVNQFGSTNAQEIIIFLDVEDETVITFDDIHEKQIRLAATLATRFIEAGIPVGIVTNGKDIKWNQTLHLEAGTGKQQLLNINRGLSRIDLGITPEEMARIVDNERENLQHLQKTYIMISKNQRTGCYHAFRNLIGQGASGFWISTRYDDMEWRLPVYGNLPVIHWEVER